MTRPKKKQYKKNIHQSKQRGKSKKKQQSSTREKQDIQEVKDIYKMMKDEDWSSLEEHITLEDYSKKFKGQRLFQLFIEKERLSLLKKAMDLGYAPNQGELHYAIQLHKAEIVKLLTEYPITNVNALARCRDNLTYYTPLAVAVGLLDLESTKILLKCGANPDISVEDGKTCMHLAIESAYSAVIRLDKGDILVTRQIIQALADNFALINTQSTEEVGRNALALPALYQDWIALQLALKSQNIYYHDSKIKAYTDPIAALMNDAEQKVDLQGLAFLLRKDLHSVKTKLGYKVGKPGNDYQSYLKILAKQVRGIGNIKNKGPDLIQRSAEEVKKIIPENCKKIITNEQIDIAANSLRETLDVDEYISNHYDAADMIMCSEMHTMFCAIQKIANNFDKADDEFVCDMLKELLVRIKHTVPSGAYRALFIGLRAYKHFLNLFEDYPYIIEQTKKNAHLILDSHDLSTENSMFGQMMRSPNKVGFLKTIFAFCDDIVNTPLANIDNILHNNSQTMDPIAPSVKEITNLLQKDPKQEDGDRLIHIAIKNNDHQMFEAILRHLKPDLNSRDEDGRTISDLCKQRSGFEEILEKVATEILEKKFDFNDPTPHVNFLKSLGWSQKSNNDMAENHFKHLTGLETLLAKISCEFAKFKEVVDGYKEITDQTQRINKQIETSALFNKIMASLQVETNYILSGIGQTLLDFFIINGTWQSRKRLVKPWLDQFDDGPVVIEGKAIDPGISPHSVKYIIDSIKTPSTHKDVKKSDKELLAKIVKSININLIKYHINDIYDLLGFDKLVLRGQKGNFLEHIVQNNLTRYFDLPRVIIDAIKSKIPIDSLCESLKNIDHQTLNKTPILHTILVSSYKNQDINKFLEDHRLANNKKAFSNKDDEGNTALHVAVRSGKFKILKNMLKIFDISLFDITNNYGQSVYDLVGEDNIEIFLKQFQHLSEEEQGIIADKTIKSNSGAVHDLRSLIRKAEYSYNIEQIIISEFEKGSLKDQLFLKNKSDKTILQEIILSSKNPSKLVEILKGGFDDLDEFKKQVGEVDTKKIIKTHNFEALQTIIGNAELSQAQLTELAQFSLRRGVGFVKCLDILCKKAKYQVKEPDHNGNNLLHIAAEVNDEPLFIYLLHRYPHLLFKENNFGKNPLEMAKEKEIKIPKKYLPPPSLHKLANDFQTNTMVAHKIRDAFKREKNKYKELYKKDENGRTIIQEVVINHKNPASLVNILKTGLKEAGDLYEQLEQIDIETLVASNNAEALSVIINNNPRRIEKAIEVAKLAVMRTDWSSKIIDMLLKQGYNLYSKDGEGNCLLHYAALNNKTSAFQYLLTKAPKTLFIKNQSEKMALDLAKDSNIKIDDKYLNIESKKAPQVKLTKEHKNSGKQDKIVYTQENIQDFFSQAAHDSKAEIINYNPGFTKGVLEYIENAIIRNEVLLDLSIPYLLHQKLPNTGCFPIGLSIILNNDYLIGYTLPNSPINELDKNNKTSFHYLLESPPHIWNTVFNILKETNQELEVNQPLGSKHPVYQAMVNPDLQSIGPFWSNVMPKWKKKSPLDGKKQKEGSQEFVDVINDAMKAHVEDLSDRFEKIKNTDYTIYIEDKNAVPALIEEVNILNSNLFNMHNNLGKLNQYDENNIINRELKKLYDEMIKYSNLNNSSDGAKKGFVTDDLADTIIEEINLEDHEKKVSGDVEG